MCWILTIFYLFYINKSVYGTWVDGPLMEMSKYKFYLDTEIDFI